jgi:hypothetical protein
LWAIGSLVVLAVLFFVGVLIGGSVSGSEFSPQTFSIRYFNYARVPILNWQVSKTSVDSVQGSLACSVNITRNIPGAIQGTPRWDLIQYSVSGREFPPGDAAILIEYLKASDANGLAVWDLWTIDHPNLAAVLWPVVQQLAIHQCYFAIPDIMQYALTKPSVDELKEHIKQVCQTNAEVRARKFIAESKSSEARALIAWALTLGPSPKLDSLLVSLEDSPNATVEPNEKSSVDSSSEPVKR